MPLMLEMNQNTYSALKSGAQNTQVLIRKTRMTRLLDKFVLDYRGLDQTECCDGLPEHQTIMLVKGQSFRRYTLTL